MFSFVWWNVPMLQALIPVLHLLLPRAYFSASNGSGDELSSYLKVKTVVAIGKKLVQLEWVPIGRTRFFHLLPVPQVIYTFPLFVYQVIISCKLQSFFLHSFDFTFAELQRGAPLLCHNWNSLPRGYFHLSITCNGTLFPSPACMHYLPKP
jgi:hypothetical protein